MAPEDLSELWVFGYGSLIWHPGFSVAEQRIATLSDYRRAFCMSSIHHRGTDADPGLVLALDVAAGASCRGVAFRVTPGAEAETLANLRERELVSSAYYEDVIDVTLEGGGPLKALSYIVDRGHIQYRGDLSLEKQAQIIASAVGGRGPNTEYLWNTADHLRGLGIEDHDLNWLSDRVRALI
ncbi:MAG: cation transport protein ChaC [Paracoccaceae bacterium]|jgi:cation transport protein ChaC